MELREAEALGIEYHHHGGVGHVHAHFYYGCCHENLRFAFNKLLHLFFLFGGFHLAVHLAETEFGEHFEERGEAFLKVLQVELLALLDEREHDIHLSALAYLLADAVVETRCLVVVFMYCHHGLASWRQLVYHAHVEIAVDGHGECARYRCGGHHEHVGRILALAP